MSKEDAALALPVSEAAARSAAEKKAVSPPMTICVERLPMDGGSAAIYHFSGRPQRKPRTSQSSRMYSRDP